MSTEWGNKEEHNGITHAHNTDLYKRCIEKHVPVMLALSGLRESGSLCRLY